MVGMNISSTGPSPAIAPTQAVDKRVQLQAMLLRKSVDLQQQETTAMMRETEGKGQAIDIRC